MINFYINYVKVPTGSSSDKHLICILSENSIIEGQTLSKFLMRWKFLTFPPKTFLDQIYNISFFGFVYFTNIK